MHVAEIDFLDFYAPAFADLAEGRQFVECVRGISGRESHAKVILHQAARMIWLGDQMDRSDIARGRSALQILFFMIAAETVAKLAFNFVGEGQSKRFARHFFGEICLDAHRGRLGRAFKYVPGVEYMSWERAVDLLYAVRCDVVHEGMYYAFSLVREPGGIPTLTSVGDENFVAEITLSEIRQIVLEGALRGCIVALPSDSPCHAFATALR